MPVGLQVFRANGSIKIDTGTQLTRLLGFKLLTAADMYPVSNGPYPADWYQKYTMPDTPANLGKPWYQVNIPRDIGEITSGFTPEVTVNGRTVTVYHGPATSQPASRDVLIRWGAY